MKKLKEQQEILNKNISLMNKLMNASADLINQVSDIVTLKKNHRIDEGKHLSFEYHDRVKEDKS